MSVIMGYKTEDKIYLGADNRVSTPEDTFIRDDVNKIFGNYSEPPLGSKCFCEKQRK